jgi:hypothetical protein
MSHWHDKCGLSVPAGTLSGLYWINKVSMTSVVSMAFKWSQWHSNMSDWHNKRGLSVPVSMTSVVSMARWGATFPSAWSASSRSAAQPHSFASSRSA